MKDPTDTRPIRRVTIFVIIALALLMTSVDSTIVATALHTMQHDLGTTANWIGWTITGYALGMVLMLPITGVLSERLGRRRVFMWSLGIFTAASLLSGLSPNVYVLIGLRIIQAVGGAGLTPSATGIIVDYFGEARDKAVSLFGSVFPIGTMIGPIFGGFLVTSLGWRSIFYVNVPIGIAAILLALRFIPRDTPGVVSGPKRLDVRGIVLLGIGVTAGMLAVSYLGQAGAVLYSPLFIVMALIGLAGIWLFWRHVRRVANPILAPRLIAGKGFGAVNLLNVLVGGVASGAIVLLPLYAANRYQIGTLAAGLLLIAEGIASIVFTVVMTELIRRTGYRRPMYYGCVIIAIGVVMIALTPPASFSTFAWLMLAAAIIGIGGGVISPPTRNAGLQLAPEHSSELAALRTMGRQFGIIVVTASATALIAATSDSGVAQAWFYVVSAGLVLLSLLAVPRIQEHFGSW